MDRFIIFTCPECGNTQHKQEVKINIINTPAGKEDDIHFVSYGVECDKCNARGTIATEMHYEYPQGFEFFSDAIYGQRK